MLFNKRNKILFFILFFFSIVQNSNAVLDENSMEFRIAALKASQKKDFGMYKDNSIAAYHRFNPDWKENQYNNFSVQQREAYDFLVAYDRTRDTEKRKELNQSYLRNNFDKPIDFSHMILMDLDLSNIELPDVSFVGSKFTFIKLCNANFQGSDFKDVLMNHVKIKKTSFSDCNLENSKITVYRNRNYKIYNYPLNTFIKYKKKKEYFSPCQRELYTFLINYSKSDNKEERKKMNQQFLEKFDEKVRDFSGMDLVGLDLSDLSMPYACFNHTYIEDVNLINSDFSSSSFIRAKISKCEVDSANFTRANFQDAVIKDTNIEKSNLQDSTFR